MNAPTILDLVQGTDAWAKHRSNALNASDAPAMMGASKYRSRADLVRERATGVVREVDTATQRLFDRGHAAEAAARPIIEKELGDELFPVIVKRTIEGITLSASLDGLTMDGATAWENKLYSESLATQVRAGELDMHYVWQLEHQLAVSGADRVIFTTSNGVDCESMEYRAVPGRLEQLIAGWKQFLEDVADYVPEPTVATPVAAPVEGFGALSLRVEGRVLASNLDAFKAGADAFIARLPNPAELQTDQDFADADAAAKACAEAESRIKAAKDAALSQMADVDTVLRAADTICESIRTARLALEKAVKAEKESRKAAIVADAVYAVRTHYWTINATLGEHAILAPQSLSIDIGASIKGLRTLASIRDAVAGAVAKAKIDANQRADSVRASIAALAEASKGHEALFADRVTLCAEKAPDDIRNIAVMRIAEHEKREADRKEQERERIRAEEAAKVTAAPRPIVAAADVFEAITEPCWPQVDDGARISLGDINSRIAPLSISGDGLAQLGFHTVGKARAAKLYAASDFPAICAALISRINAAAMERAA